MFVLFEETGMIFIIDQYISCLSKSPLFSFPVQGSDSLFRKEMPQTIPSSGLSLKPARGKQAVILGSWFFDPGWQKQAAYLPFRPSLPSTFLYNFESMLLLLMTMIVQQRFITLPESFNYIRIFKIHCSSARGVFSLSPVLWKTKLFFGKVLCLAQDQRSKKQQTWNLTTASAWMHPLYLKHVHLSHYLIPLHFHSASQSSSFIHSVNNIFGHILNLPPSLINKNFAAM